jgi:N-acyl amino acid synthase of PEP-CTERM/exosortase system
MQRLIFKKVSPSDIGLLKKVYQLRLQVYARECGFISERDYPAGIEFDAYDAHSIHFAVLNCRKEVVGTTRMILNQKGSLPISQFSSSIIFNEKDLAQSHFAEISRLVFRKDCRRQMFSQMREILDEQKKKTFWNQNPFGFLQHTKSVAVSLCRELYNESVNKGITHWVCLMEKHLAVLLRMYGFPFECMGDVVDYFGPVYPFVGKVTDMENVLFDQSHVLENILPEFPTKLDPSLVTGIVV